MMIGPSMALIQRAFSAYHQERGPYRDPSEAEEWIIFHRHLVEQVDWERRRAEKMREALK